MSMNVHVKWAGKEYEITDVDPSQDVLALKVKIMNKTGVRPERQKLLNLKIKGKAASDDALISSLGLKPNFKIMMMGSLEESIVESQTTPTDLPEVLNDFDIEEEEVTIEQNENNLVKIEKRVREYEVKVLNPSRENKKLLVLDIDYTLFDHRSVAETGWELMRPFLHEFLETAYEYYDICIWSATNMVWIEEKMKLLGCTTNPNYKLAFYLDSRAMISISTPKYGIVDVKPLGVIWGKYPQYSPKNTIMFDDLRRNFLMNPQNGLKIRPFREAHSNRDKDKELVGLSKYLTIIAKHEDLSTLRHSRWERYIEK
ncbi:ubiquitin-like domain-containing CTD phosphatase 1 [Eurytemora carolleeae]|uniref:ubiquitin-like domain-containing CTD phosphatase 1 n=1 Tax=Eurytemora carolleeae TaxID=1294199 RepID=UPI000C7837A0|nr:ubiquitin-like domain-containing CTD phosphatase 1 [Eurytemora carolleeae]XP_023323188.1 ubiquitin-like domain-containing CTD phosphatase 1 [Eurytemora carolleeae]XP_023323189.1 ubiquitin-like domain-containing CTD phosphatase 1 [Eurytemora carolleeae]XP_023323190.1 ubiquitin-like domain-containing CTD phosphatase 1 [Eurytemora carolleeae]|eukprot:XP_023323187.1 ubiquitin-like domain-containing CTD phosphatase 1 [Eurytemora affinis]